MTISDWKKYKKLVSIGQIIELFRTSKSLTISKEKTKNGEQKFHFLFKFKTNKK